MNKSLLLIIPLLMLIGGCDTLGPLFGSYQNKILSEVSANVGGTYTIIFTKDGKTVHTESWTCKAVEGKLPVCHLDGARTLSTDVSAPVVPVK